MLLLKFPKEWGKGKHMPISTCRRSQICKYTPVDSYQPHHQKGALSFRKMTGTSVTKNGWYVTDSHGWLPMWITSSLTKGKGGSHNVCSPKTPPHITCPHAYHQNIHTHLYAYFCPTMNKFNPSHSQLLDWYCKIYLFMAF